MPEVEICIVCDALTHEVNEMFKADDLIKLHIMALKAMNNLNRLLNLKCEQLKNRSDK